MKRISHFCIVTILAMPFLLTACMDNDVYDPGKVKPAEPTENPFGEDLNVPEGFSWSMINSIKLNVEVKDDYQGQYRYLIEVFATNPFSDEAASPIAAGYANKNANYTAELSIPKTTARLFIRQTDPNQRKEVYEYAVPENGGTLNCKLYYAAATTKAMTRASGEGGTSGWDGITDPGYTEQTYNIPAQSDEIIYGNQLNPGAVFVVKRGATLTGTLNSYNGKNATVYVQGTWNLVPDWTNISGIDIIVLDGGKLISSGNQLTLQNNTTLTVQTGGEVNCQKLCISTNLLVKNFGTISSKNYNFNTGSVIYNKGTINITGTIPNSDWEHNFVLNGAVLYNHGTVTGISSRIGTNDSLETKILNYPEASIDIQAIVGGGTIVNSGYIVAKCCKNNSNDALYNNCLFIITDRFEFRHVVLDKGSITGGKTSDGEWLPVPYIENPTDAKITLIDGSMIKATKIHVKSGDVRITATNSTDNDSKSMIKAEEQIYFAEPTHVYLTGNLVIEGKIVKSNEEWPFAKNESVSTGYDESKYTIETCGGIFNEGNEGLPPGTPTIPVEIEDGATYTYAFEDQWPIYGDFDMNDIVITIDKKSLTSQNKKLSIQGRIRAVGAGQNIGAGIRFLGTSASAITSVEGKTQSTNGAKGSLIFESGQKYPVIILCDDAHKFCGNPDGDKTFFCTDPNVNSQYNTGDGANFEITMEFSNEADAQKAYAIDNIDVFIINKAASKGIGRTEVHVAGYAPTDVADTNSFGTANDASKANSAFGCAAKGNYISVDGLAWGICVPLLKTDADTPNVWAWPLERTIITSAYSGFKTWITTNGADAKDWASNPVGNKIFVKPSN